MAAQFTLRFRVRAKEQPDPNTRKIILTPTRLTENAGMTENQSHFGDGEGLQSKIELVMDRATEVATMTVGSDVLVTFLGPS